MPDQEMIERVAKAIYDNRFSPEDAAIAAIKAMREPTEKMINYGLIHYLNCEKNKLPWNGKLLYEVMIGSILND